MGYCSVIFSPHLLVLTHKHTFVHFKLFLSELQREILLMNSDFSNFIIKMTLKLIFSLTAFVVQGCFYYL